MRRRAAPKGGPLRVKRKCLQSVSDRGDAMSKLGLAVRGLVLVDDALGDGDVQLARSNAQGGQSLVLVAGLNGLAGLADQGLQLGLHGLVANAALLVGEDALLWDLMFATVGFLLDVCLTGSVRAVSRPGLRRGDTRKRS